MLLDAHISINNRISNLLDISPLKLLVNFNSLWSKWQLRESRQEPTQTYLRNTGVRSWRSSQQPNALPVSTSGKYAGYTGSLPWHSMWESAKLHAYDEPDQVSVINKVAKPLANCKNRLAQTISDRVWGSSCWMRFGKQGSLDQDVHDWNGMDGILMNTA